MGSQKVVGVDIRVIAATNHDLRARIREGRFREDLYYRLNTLPLLVPPLRERPEDVFLLLANFLAAHARADLQFDPEAREVLQHYAWPGNIRELANVASYLSFMAGATVDLEALPHYLFDASVDGTETALGCGAEQAREVLQALAQHEGRRGTEEPRRDPGAQVLGGGGARHPARAPGGRPGALPDRPEGERDHAPGTALPEQVQEQVILRPLSTCFFPRQEAQAAPPLDHFHATRRKHSCIAAIHGK